MECASPRSAARSGTHVRCASRLFTLPLVLTILLTFLLCIVPAAAHPPTGMVLLATPGSGDLAVTITHPVGSQAGHYIAAVTVERDGVTILEQNYSFQPPSDTFTYHLPIPPATTGTLRVTARCNIGGSLSRDLILTLQSSSSGPVQRVLWPVHALLMASGFSLLVAAILLLRYKGRRWWYAAHRLAGMAGVTSTLAGLLVAGYMVAGSGGPHLRVPHAVIGVLTLSLLVATPLAAAARHLCPSCLTRLRPVHIWLGWSALVLVILTIISGLVTAGVVHSP